MSFKLIQGHHEPVQLYGITEIKATPLTKAKHGVKSPGGRKTRLIFEGLELDPKFRVYAKRVSGGTSTQPPKSLNPYIRTRFVALRVQDHKKTTWVFLNVNSGKRLGISAKKMREEFKNGTLEDYLQHKIAKLVKKQKTAAKHEKHGSLKVSVKSKASAKSARIKSVGAKPKGGSLHVPPKASKTSSKKLTAKLQQAGSLKVPKGAAASIPKNRPKSL